MSQDHLQNDYHPGQFWKLRYSIVLSMIGAIGLYFLLNEHWAHFVGALPYLLLLACPLMHVFMHHGHGGHGGGHAHKRDDVSGPT